MFKLNPKSISTKLGVMLVCIALIPLISVGSLTYFYSSNILKEKLMETSSQTISEINSGLERYFSALSSVVSLAAADKRLSDDGMSGMPQPLTLDNPTNLENTMNVPHSDNELSDTETILQGVASSNSTITNVFFARPDNTFNLYPAQELSSDFSVITRPWYLGAIENPGQVVFTDVYIDTLSGAPIITASLTVMDKNNNLVGVLGIDFSLAALAMDLSSSKVANEGFIYLVDASGLTIAHPDQSKLGTSFITELSIWEDAVAKTPNGFIEFKLDGEDHFASFTTNPLTGWKLIGEMDSTELTQSTSKIRLTTLLAVFIILIISSILSVLTAIFVAKHIAPLKKAFERVSNGDLTTRLETSVQTEEFSIIATYFNDMIEHIAHLMEQVNHSSDEILETSIQFAEMAHDSASSLAEVSIAMNEIADGASHTTAHTLEGVEDMSNLADKINQIAAQTTAMRTISQDTTRLSSKGLETTKLLSEKSIHTKTSVMEIKNQIDDLQDFAKKINLISDAISNITAQTNLLALNASIEAARAGSAGKGFAVVAEEIRQLAEESKVSTEQIKEILLQIENKSSQTAQAMENTSKIINEQDLAVTETLHIFDEIIDSINLLTTNTEEIATHVQNIDGDKDQVVSKIQEISAISEESASATEEICATTENLSSNLDLIRTSSQELKVLSEGLKENVSRFHI